MMNFVTKLSVASEKFYLSFTPSETKPQELFPHAKPTKTKGVIITMGSIFIYPGMKLTPDEIAELEALDKLPDDEIDFSDIPKITDEEFKRMRRAKDFYEPHKVAN